jgi:hypothetical protein
MGSSSSPNWIGANKIFRLAKPVAEDSSMPPGNLLNCGASQIARERNSVLRVELRTVDLAASHELSYYLTKRRHSIHMLCSGYAKVNPTGIESIDHFRPRCRPTLRHPL